MITEVAYGLTFNLGNYQSERIDCRVQVESGETPEQAMDQARQWVQMQHQQGRAMESQQERLNRLEAQIYHTQGRMEEIRRRHVMAVDRYGELRALLSKHGVEIKELDAYYLPIKDEPEPAADEDDEDDDGNDDFYEDDR